MARRCFPTRSLAISAETLKNRNWLTALVVIATLLAGCGEEWASGSIWIVNESGDEVVVRITQHDQPLSATRRAWKIPGHAAGVVANVNRGVVDLVDPADCAVLGSRRITSWAIGILVPTLEAASVADTREDGRDLPREVTHFRPMFPQTADCLEPSVPVASPIP
jgi:hypothetical protein